VHNLEGRQSVTLDTFGGLVTMANPHDLPEGASPQNNDVDYILGSVTTRAPLVNVYQMQGATVGPNAGSNASSSTWSNPLNVLTNSGNSATFGPVSNTNALNVSAFAFNLPSQNAVTGVQVNANTSGNSPFNLTAQLMYQGGPIGNAKTVTVTPGTPVTFGSPTDNWGATLSASIVNNPTFGVQFSASSAGFQNATAGLGYVTVTAGYQSGSTNINYIKSFKATDGSIKTLVLDSSGELWLEDVTNNPGVLTSLLEGITPGSYARSTTLFDREYICFSDLKQGVDVPRQYTPQGWIDRVTQSGPGAPPTFTAISSSTTQYNISSITQPAAKSQGFSYFLQSSGPGSTSPGSVVTFYYLDSTQAPGPDQDLVNAFNSGQPVYVYASFTGTPQPFGPMVVQVTSVGLGSPPGQPRKFYYFTFNVPTVAYTYYQGSGHGGYTANYQRTLATMLMAQAVPGLEVGNTVTISGTSVSQYNTNWQITQTPNSGAFNITQTQVSGGVATFSYAVTSGQPPQAGQQVTITGTNNANGQLNVKNASIVSASGGNTGTFTLNVSLPDASAEPEQGQGTTAGTVFNFDPGAGLLGSSTDPIYGNATGGSLTFGGTSGNFMAAGTRQGVVFFITRNGAVTFPSPPVVFSAAGNTITGIQASNLPIGPPNVIARGVAFTEAGQNGVPGANFYYIPNNVEYTILNQQFTATSTVVNDNSTTSAVFTFPDSVLLSATAIDVQGNNLFNQIEIGDPAWNTSYAGRLFFGGCRAKVQNFLNLSFDGGFLSNPGGAILPLGWKVDANYTPSGAVTLLNSPVFGNSLYIHNTTGSSASIFGMLTQSAYEDAYQVPIVRPSTAYSVRVTCRCPSGAASGALVIDLTDSNSTGYGQTFGSFTVNLSGMTSSMQTFTGTLLTTSFSTVPPGLLLRVWLQNAPINADVEIDRIEVFPTLQPVDASKVYVSYVDNPEGVDGVTGILDLSVQNTQPVTGAAVMYDLLYIMKESSLYSTQDSPNDEPSNWAIHEVSNRVGAIGPNAWDYGEEWLVMACRDGVYVFNGGQPAKINQEIWQIWEAINWSAGKTIWVRNDIVNRKLYVGVPLPTPNPWIPNPRTQNANPTQPNVVLVCSYLGLDAVTSFMEAPQVHTTMFGTLNATDMRRKWSIWQIPSPYADFVMRGNQAGEPDQNSAPLLLGNGVGSQRVWQFGHAPGAGYASSTTPPSDIDLGAIPSLYTTYGFVNSAKAKENQLLGYHSKRFNYMQALIDGQTYAGNPLTITMLSNTLNADAVHTYQVPGGVILTSPAQEELERPLNVRGQRIFAQFAVNQPGTSGQAGWFGLSRLIMVGAADAWAPIRGR
jgi:hypothetical protein